MKVVVDKKFEHLTDTIACLPQMMDEGKGEVVYDSRNRVVRFAVEGLSLMVKRFKRVNAVQQVVYTSAAGSEPTLTATSVQIESTTDGEDRMFEEVTLHVDPEETAQVTLSAATVSGSGCEITGATTTISGTVSPHTVNGDPVSSGVHSGKVEVDLTVGQYDSTAPTFTAGTNFELSQSATVNDPDSDMPEWTAKFTKPLELYVASSGNGS